MPTVPEVLPAVESYLAKRGNATGGSLHIVLDDSNVRDRDVEFCRQWALEHHDDDGAALAAVLLEMSPTQRRKLASVAKRP